MGGRGLEGLETFMSFLGLVSFINFLSLMSHSCLSRQECLNSQKTVIQKCGKSPNLYTMLTKYLPSLYL